MQRFLFQYGKDIRLYDSSRMMGDRARRQSDEMTDIWKKRGIEQIRYTWGIDLVNGHLVKISVVTPPSTATFNTI